MFSVDPPACPGGAVCMAMAPSMSIMETDCGDGTFGAPYTVVDAGNGSTNAGELTEYYVIDDAAGSVTGIPNGILSAGTLASAQIAIDGLVNGSELCIASIVYVQADLDAHLAELDLCAAANGLPPGSIYATLGLPTTGNTISGLVTALTATAGTTVDKASVELLLIGGTIDIGVLAGFPAGTLVCTNVPSVCYACSTTVCIVADECITTEACDGDNGTLSIKVANMNKN